MSSPAPSCVVVLRFSAAGDVMLTAPALEALKRAWPKTKLVFGVKEAFASLVRNSPYVDSVEPLRPKEGIFAYSKRLRAHAPGALLDLHGKARSRSIAWVLGLERSVVWDKRPFWTNFVVRTGLRPFHASMLIADRYHKAVEQLVGRPLERGSLKYELGSDEAREGDAALIAAGVDLARPLVGISPGANWETKRWPAERFGELAQRLIGQGLQVVLTGSASERPITAQVRALAPEARDLAGILPLGALAGVMARCRAFIANDSGPMHMARGLGVPTLAIFGSTDPGQFDFTGHGLLFAGVPCSPCHFYGRKKCPRSHFACMEQLDVERAWQTLAPLLTSERRGAVRG